jgi:hypothetical protein
MVEAEKAAGFFEFKLIETIGESRDEKGMSRGLPSSLNASELRKVSEKSSCDKALAVARSA